jgi:PilZ domain
MGSERRRSPRVRVKLPARWEGALHQESATITDLSRTGCFVLSGGTVEVKELIWLEIHLPAGEPVQFWGEVVDAAYEIGFAVKFNSGSDEDEARLISFIDNVLASESRSKS